MPETPHEIDPLTPKFPPGTPEYEEYAADLKAELGKFARREAPYDSGIVSHSQDDTRECAGCEDGENAPHAPGCRHDVSNATDRETIPIRRIKTALLRIERAENELRNAVVDARKKYHTWTAIGHIPGIVRHAGQWFGYDNPVTSTDPDDPTSMALPVTDDVVTLTDGTTARVLSRIRYQDGSGWRERWQVAPTNGEAHREISLEDIVGYLEDDKWASEAVVPVEIPGADGDHAAALVLNAAIDWEIATERLGFDAHMAAADALHAAVRAYMPLVTK